MKASEEIRATKELLMENEWVQGGYEVNLWDEEKEEAYNGYCLIGAYGKAVQDNARAYLNRANYASISPLNALRCILDATGTKEIPGFPFRCDIIEQWNDAPGRTFEQVCDVLDKAEKLALIREENA